MKPTIPARSIRETLVSALTQYDAKQFARTKGSRAKGYNPYALAIYFERLDDVCADIEHGADIRKAICAGLVGPTASACLRALGLPAWTKEDETRGNWSYRPASPEYAAKVDAREEAEIAKRDAQAY